MCANILRTILLFSFIPTVMVSVANAAASSAQPDYHANDILKKANDLEFWCEKKGKKSPELKKIKTLINQIRAEFLIEGRNYNDAEKKVKPLYEKMKKEANIVFGILEKRCHKKDSVTQDMAE